jgi:hypothetical protein
MTAKRTPIDTLVARLAFLAAFTVVAGLIVGVLN